MTRQNSDLYNDFFQLVSKLALTRIKRLSQTGEKINVASLAHALSSEQDIRRFVENNMLVADQGPTSPKTPDSPADKLEQLKSQKAGLIRELDELEFRLDEKEQFCKKALLLMSNLSSNPCNTALQQYIDKFKRLVQQDAKIKDLQSALNQLRDRALSEVPDDLQHFGGNSSGRRSKTHKKSALASTPDNHPISEKNSNFNEQSLWELLKVSYQDLIQGLRLCMGDVYQERLILLNKRIENVQSLENITQIGNDIITLLREFVDNISAEREAQAAAVLHEISCQVNEMEFFLTDSLDQVGETKKSNAEFNSRMVAELRELNQNANFSETLAELKKAVSTKLAKIKAALEKKNAEDELRNADITRKIENLRNGLQHMKTEADAAHQKIGKLKKQLLVDPLTGAFNRKAYDERIKDELERYLRYNRTFSLLLFDIDHFKIVNDRYGHAIGDKCLQEITRHTQALLRQNDVLFRFGGEEFVIILPETDRRGALQVAEKLRFAIEYIDFIMKEETLKITISIGLTMVNAQDKNVSNLFNRVDAAMYEAKQKGRNCVVQK
jgi:diguanylate cyclase (GGDEF)-like protein